MSNNAKYTTGRLSTPSRSTAAMFIHAGYTDYRQGLGYRKDYDEFSEIDQKRYELGRYYAAILAGAGEPVLPWHKNRLLKMGNQVNEARTESFFVASRRTA